MPAKMFTSTTRSDGRDVIHSSTRMQPRRAAAHLAGANVAEVQRLSPARGQFVDQHHRQPGAGGDQADFAVRIELDIIEALAQLAVGIGIDARTGLDQRGDARLAFDRVQIDHHFRVARHTAGRRRRTAD